MGILHVQYSLSHSMSFAVLELIGTLAEWGREYLPHEPKRAGVGLVSRPLDSQFKPEDFPRSQKRPKEGPVR